MFNPAPGANDWYDVPKKTGKVFFTEPYNYPIDGKPVLMASLVAPILVGINFRAWPVPISPSRSWEKFWPI